jgi:hypothetical protein
MAHASRLALELSIAPKRRGAYSAMTQRVREAMARGGVVESHTTNQVGWRIEPALDEPNERLVVTWHDPGLDADDPLSRARQRQALERILWLVVDEVDDISGAHLQGWGDPFVVVNYGGFDTDDGS